MMPLWNCLENKFVDFGIMIFHESLRTQAFEELLTPLI